jgi:dihydroorotate dehydrogenase (fumarate)
MRSWLEDRKYESLGQIKGSMSRVNAPDREAYERANYVKTLVSYTDRMP